MPAPALPDLEISRLLEADATRRFGPIPPALLAAHVLAVTPDGDVPLRRAALDALMRRFASAEEQNPGWRCTPRLGKRVRAGRVELQTELGQVYELHLQSFARLRGSCSCADFAHGALGLCKHLLFMFARGFDDEGRAEGDGGQGDEWLAHGGLQGEGDCGPGGR